jgi:hypothetical protein
MPSRPLPPSRRTFLRRFAQAGIVTSVTSLAPTRLRAATPGDPQPQPLPAIPNPVIAHPGAWQFQLPRASIILVSDQQLLDLTDPDREVDLSLSSTPHKTTLRQLCRQHADAGARTVILAFDEFWSQYRAGQGGKPRQWTPDTDAYISHVGRIGETLREHGLGFELSLLSPLEIGPGYARATGETGGWVQFREGWRDPATGAYSVALWEQRRWTNNKGTIELRRRSVRAFAFRERRIGASAFYAVDPSDIVELRQPPELVEGSESPSAKHRRLTIRGTGDPDANPRDRVLVVVSYDVPELDYFSPKALPFLEHLVRRYHAAGIPLNGLYADEMHIQQDWGYADHHEEGQFALRYLTPNLARRFAELHGAEYADLERWLVYFCHGQHSFLPNIQARLDAQHAVGSDPDAIQRTALFRRRYYELLHQTVVDLFVRAKSFAESLYGRPLEARAHATWAQSPTIDFWNVRNQPHPPRQYEYTPDFLWSNTVQQAASACSDYFAWNDFLTGGGNDHAEGGWSDRNYYGLALACSTGSLNDIPNAYAAAWGLPAPAPQRHRTLENAFGCSPDPAIAAITDFAHREVPVLMLYPSSLVATDERFGSWMVQYGYANFVSPAKLVQHAQVTDHGSLNLRGRAYSTVAVLFEPLPPPDLLPLLERFVAAGGRLIWSGPPPRLDLAGNAVLQRWLNLCGATRLLTAHEGLTAPGTVIRFEDRLAPVPPQPVLTDLRVDQLWPVEPAPDTRVVARQGQHIVGIHRPSPAPGRGHVTFLGFRPRDDQAASLGYESRTWFEILTTLGAYPGPDDPSVLSRNSPHLVTRFPNGTIAVAAHYRHHVESWPGGFHRDAQQDQEILKQNPLPPESLDLKAFVAAGHRIDFQGERLVAFRLETSGHLTAFAGHQTDRIHLDGNEHRFSDRPLAFVAWAPVHPSRRVPGGAVAEVWVHGEGRLRIPLCEPTTTAVVLRAGRRPGETATQVPARLTNGFLELEAHPAKAQGHLYVLPA